MYGLFKYIYTYEIQSNLFKQNGCHFVGFVMPWLNFHIETTSETIANGIVTNLHMLNQTGVSVVPKPHPVDGMISPMIFDSVNVAKCL